jgi:hypothetical protein
MRTQGHLQGFNVRMAPFASHVVLLNHADTFFDKHPCKGVEIDLAPRFAATRTMVACLLDFRGLDCQRFDSWAQLFALTPPRF